jgi:hypothetical protein
MPEDPDPIPVQMNFVPVTPPTRMFVQNVQIVIDPMPIVEMWLMG